MNKECLINIVFILFLVLIGVTAYLMLRPGHIIGGDYSLYIRQAKCIVGDTQLVAENMKFMLVNSSDDKFSPVLYPWGFPLLLSPLYYISGINFDFKKDKSVSVSYTIRNPECIQDEHNCCLKSHLKSPQLCNLSWSLSNKN